MLDQYKSSQPIVYKILKNAITKDKYSHAYLIETNGYTGSLDLALSFTKALLCPNKFTSNKNCQNCNQCQIIDSGNFPEIEIIKPDGIWIKKQQLTDLQNEFSKKAIIGNKKIYIITEAEKLNKQSSNSLLKFLEEPEQGIIAILITDSTYQVLETIRSRCQILSLKQNITTSQNQSTQDYLLQTYYNNDINQTEKIETILKFIRFYEKNHLSTILYLNKLWHNQIKTKEDYEIALDILILYYKDILNHITNQNIDIFKDQNDQIKQISSANTLTTISHKITTLIHTKEKIKYNANTSLLMDKLIIELERR